MTKQGWYARCFAWAMSKAGPAHGQLVYRHKRALFGGLQGTVLEIGPGTGANLAFFRPEIRWIGHEPNLHMHPYLRQEARRLGLAIEILGTGSEQIPLADCSADAVVSSLVLCSVRSLEQTIAEIQRVLRPGGQFAFIEHVAAPRGSPTRVLQDLITPVWRMVGDGCHPNREILPKLQQAGFSRLQVEEFTIPVPIAGPHIAGLATRG
jgi:ubiquinone/menaquinone biosynthesis C-methylase UbiE